MYSAMACLAFLRVENTVRYTSSFLRSKERLGERVVPTLSGQSRVMRVWLSGSAHRTNYLVAGQMFGKVVRYVLRPAVGVEHCAKRDVAVGMRHGDRIADQFGAHVLCHRPANDFFGAQIDHRGQNNQPCQVRM